MRAAYQRTQLLGWLAHLRYLHEATHGDLVMGILWAGDITTNDNGGLMVV